jgi:hypothetical protein
MLSFEALREARVVVRTTLVALKRPFFSILRKVTRFAHPRTHYSNIISHYECVTRKNKSVILQSDKDTCINLSMGSPANDMCFKCL